MVTPCDPKYAAEIPTLAKVHIQTPTISPYIMLTWTVSIFFVLLVESLFLVETTPSKWCINIFLLAKTSPSHGFFFVHTAAPKITRPYRPPEQRSTHPVPPVRYLHLGSSPAVGISQGDSDTGLGILRMWYYTYHLCIQVCIDIYIYNVNMYVCVCVKPSS